ncbi:MAG: hypothetical protein GY757_38100, partial [bacterium]|nr:hypothetical protein [bacterium]
RSLIFSKAFIDYSTGGLENPLTHLLVALFFWVFLKKDLNRKTLFLLTLTAALMLTNRMDTILVVGPALAYTYFRILSSRAVPWKQFIKIVAAGFLPFILWEFFSLVYFGFPFPNTAYAKLNTGVPGLELVEQGFYYLLNSLNMDPLTLVFIIWSIVMVFLCREKRPIFISLGILLYMLYIIKIGGDFMTGRFLAILIFTAIFTIPERLFFLTIMRPALIGVFLVIGFCGPFPPITSGTNYGSNTDRKVYMTPKGITDERAFYFNKTGLLKISRYTKISDELGKKYSSGKYFKLKGNIYSVGACGYFGYFLGTRGHIVDNFALNDPLLARLPIVSKRRWRIGHFKRPFPSGYIDTLISGENKIVDHSLSEFYDKLSLVTRGPLFSFKRFKEILKINLGSYRHLLDNYLKEPQKVPLDLLSTVKPERTRWDSVGTVLMGEKGIRVPLKEKCHPFAFEISLDNNDIYKIIFMDKNKVVGSKKLNKKKHRPRGLSVQRKRVPRHVRKQGFDTICIVPEKGDHMYSIGHLIFVDKL